MSRKISVYGNWKLNGSLNFVNQFISYLSKEVPANASVAIFPPALYTLEAAKLLSNSSIKLGVQNCGVNLTGAYTGETSVEQIKDVGASLVLLGHSERRQYHHETDQLIAQKLEVVKQQGLIPVLCIGETLEEKEAGKTNQVCKTQLQAVIDHLGIDAFAGTIIAYEPVWAIGTGKSANPEYAQETHKFIRQFIASYNPTVAEQTTILYGGSVNAANAASYFAKEDVDGALVGGASLKNEFIDIINASLI